MLGLDVFLLKTDPCHLFKNIYLNHKNLPYVGIYLLNAPKLVIIDLELIKSVLAKDFQYFQSRNEVVDPNLDPLLSKSVLMISGLKWKFVRNMITPSFTFGKIKAAFGHVDKCGQEMVQYLQRLTKDGSPCLLKDAMGRFTAQTIIGYIMGIEIDNFGESESPMITYLKRIIVLDVKQELTMVLMAAIPKLQQLLRMKEAKGIFRNDFMQSIIEMRKKGDLALKEKSNGKTTVDELNRMDEEDIVSQFATLLITGFETSASTLMFGIYELALNLEIQIRLRKEIKSVLEKHNQKVTFDALQEMKYLDMVVSSKFYVVSGYVLLKRNNIMVVSSLNIVLGVLGIITASIVFIYLYFTRNFNYWKILGVPYVQPSVIAGNLGNILFQKRDIARHLQELYLGNKDKPYVGFFSFDIPCLLINDLDLVKNVLVKQFQSFTDRNVNVNSQTDPMFGRFMFSLKGQEWKHVRVHLTPVFSTGKMKGMFHLVEKCAGDLDNFIDDAISKGKYYVSYDATKLNSCLLI
ncbi:hypothetical protein C0J52_27796 [Blattella germanica]|nr:hypothetical protein C0J52_27796 [Blattella germanica]